MVPPERGVFTLLRHPMVLSPNEALLTFKHVAQPTGTEDLTRKYADALIAPTGPVLIL